MKDKKCTDFVFMPLGDKAGGTTTSSSRSSTPRSTASRSSSLRQKRTNTPDSAAGSSSKGDRSTPTNDLESSINTSGSSSATTSPVAGGKEVRSKIVVVGSCGCGKSALIHRYVQSQFLETYTPTGFETHTSQYSVSDTYKIHMSIWDTSGDSGFDRVRHLSYTEAHLVIICFAIDDPTSMDEVMSKWYPEIREHCPNQPVMLVGCKSDRRNEIKAMAVGADRPAFVTYDQGLKIAKQIKALVYSETSARSSQRSVNDVMEVAALSSAGSKNGSSTSCSSGTTTTASNGSTDSRATTASSNSSHSAGGAGGSDSPNFRRQRSFIRRKRFNGMTEAKTQLRKEAAKSCAVM